MTAWDGEQDGRHDGQHQHDDQQDTTWVEHGATEQVRPDPDTVRLGEQPTLADPSVPPTPTPPPPPPAAPATPVPPAAAPPPAWSSPGWSSPSGSAPSAPSTPPPAQPVQQPSWPAPAMPAPAAPQGPGAPGAPGQPPQWTGAALPGVQGWGAVPQAPKPGVVPLRPLGLGEILDGSISYVRRDPKTVLGISAVMAMIIALVQTVVVAALGGGLFTLLDDPSFGTSGEVADPSSLVGPFAGLVTAALVAGLITFVLQIVATGMLTVVMSRAVLGRRVSSREAWERVKPSFWPLIGVTLLVGLLVGAVATLGIVLAFMIGGVIESAGGSGLGIVLGFFIAVATALLTVWLGVRYLLAPAALVLERSGAVEAMRRSALLVKGAWWRTFGIYLLATILVSVVAQVLSFPLSFLAGLIPVLDSGAGFALILSLSVGLTTLLTTMITLPFTSGVVALLYIDRRIRREALDLELQRAAAAA